MKRHINLFGLLNIGLNYVCYTNVTRLYFNKEFFVVLQFLRIQKYIKIITKINILIFKFNFPFFLRILNHKVNLRSQL